MDFQAEGGWPRRRPLPPPSHFDAIGCLGIVLVLAVVLLVIACCAL